jgi:hypothetical protein
LRALPSISLRYVQYGGVAPNLLKLGFSLLQCVSPDAIEFRSTKK